MEYKHCSIFALLLSILVAPFIAFAAPTLPDAKVWVSPVDAKPTEAITLHAFVFNTEKEEVTFTVSFREAGKEVVGTTIIVPSETAKVATAAWTMPEKSTVLTATVTKAVNKQKKDITSLHGSLGTVTVGSTAVLPKIDIPGGTTIKAWFGGVLEKAEVFRVRNAGYFIRLREEAKADLGINSIEGITKKIMTPEVPAQDPKDAEEVVVEDKNKPEDYAKLAYATMLAPLFAQKAIFYIVLVLLTLFIVRFIVSRFF